jgi:glycosyltransferase 2 family protein
MYKKIVPIFIFGFIVLVALSFFGDFKKTFHLIISFKWQFFPIFLFLSSLNFFFRFIRWQYLLKKIHVNVSIKNSLLIFLSGLAMAVTPLRTGELMKSAMIKKITGDKISHTAPLVFVERLTDAIGMLILMSAGLAIFHYGQSVFFLSLIVVVAFIMIVNNEKMSFKIIKIISKLPILSRHSEKFVNLYSSSKILLEYKSLLPLIFLSTLAWGSTVVGGSLIFFLLGVRFSFTILLSFSFIFCFSGAIGFLTAIPGGLGISEASVTGLSILLLSIPKDIAVAGVLITRLSTLWFGTVIGIIALTIFYKRDSRR